MERGRLPAKAVGGDRRQQVLGGVLLHVVEAPPPVEGERRRAGGRRAGEDVAGAIAGTPDVDHENISQPAAICRLAAAFRI